jgi:hypothetical protein
MAAGTLSSEQHDEVALDSEHRDDLSGALVRRTKTPTDALVTERRGRVAAEELDDQVVRATALDVTRLGDQFSSIEDDEVAPSEWLRATWTSTVRCRRAGAPSGFYSARSADTHVETLRVMLTTSGASVLDVTDEERLAAEVVHRDVSPITSVGAG